jgi:hypothetical protein
MNNSTDREIDLLYTEIVDLRTLYRAIGSDFDRMRGRFNLVIISTCILSALVGGADVVALLAQVL